MSWVIQNDLDQLPLQERLLEIFLLVFLGEQVVFLVSEDGVEAIASGESP